MLISTTNKYCAGKLMCAAFINARVYKYVSQVTQRTSAFRLWVFDSWSGNALVMRPTWTLCLSDVTGCYGYVCLIVVDGYCTLSFSQHMRNNGDMLVSAREMLTYWCGLRRDTCRWSRLWTVVAYLALKRNSILYIRHLRLQKNLLLSGSLLIRL